MTNNSPIEGYGIVACIIRFFIAFLFGLFVDFVVAYFILDIALGTQSSSIFWLLVIIPIVWGILGIFFLNQMVDLAKQIFEGLVSR